MDHKCCPGFCVRGVGDCGTSSMELPFKELEKLITGILEDNNPPVKTGGQCIESKSNFFIDDKSVHISSTGGPCATLVPQSSTLAHFFIQDKSNYFSKVTSNIMETKKNFLYRYADVNASIEEMARQIVLSVKAREQKLKFQLKKLKEEKIARWDRQLNVCQEALDQLYRCEISSFYNRNHSSYFFDELTKELEFVDAGEVELDPVNYSEILTSLQNVGKLTYHVTRGDGFAFFKSVMPKFVFGEGGEEPGQFCRSWGVCSDPMGRILVCDRSNHRIQIFNESGEFLLQFGKLGSGSGEFNRPTGIDVDDKCRIIVADKDNHRIQVFSYSGYYRFGFGSRGTEPGQFMYPWDVSTNKNCDIAVSDSKNNRIQLFNERGLVIGIFDAQSMGIRNPRTALKYLDSPRGLAFRPDGSLLVTDFNNHRVLLINKAFDKAVTFGSEGIEPGQFFRPQGIACDKSGKFAVADSKNYRVQVFDSNSSFIRSFGSHGSEPGQFDCPQGISFHPNHNILVVDLSNNRVQVF